MPEQNQKPNTGKPAFLRRRDLFIIAAVLAVGLVLLFVFAPRGQTGAVAVVTVGYGEKQTVQEIPLATDTLVEIGAVLPVHLEVKDGAIRFVDSVCPDHVCEEFGWLRYEGDWATCMPAGVNVRIREET